jgi:hypothetical protein
MEVIILDDRIFKSRNDLFIFLTNELNRGIDISKYNVKIGTLQIETESNGSDLLKAHILEKSRETKINSLIGSDLVAKFKAEFIRFAPENKNKKAILNKLNLISDLESLSKFVKNNSNYFLYETSDSVYWLFCILSVYNFRSIKDEYIKEYIDPNGGASRFGLRTTPDTLKKNFREAKNIIKNKSKIKSK